MKTLQWRSAVRIRHTGSALLLLGALSATPAAAQDAQPVCGSLENHYGPYDYRTERSAKLRIVERFHFTPVVEALIRGSTGSVGDDLNYTLMTSPNHHRALIAMTRLAERAKSPRPPNMAYSVTCFFDRAVRFQPDDTVVRELYAQYLGKIGRTKEAIQQLEVANELAKDNPLSHYNIGLIYFELKEYDHALTQAHIASRQGYARADLGQMLKSVGKWQEPLPTAETPAPAASAAR